jgi:hypothetical protein
MTKLCHNAILNTCISAGATSPAFQMVFENALTDPWKRYVVFDLASSSFIMPQKLGNCRESDKISAKA